jgi:hypothetical protein
MWRMSQRKAVEKTYLEHARQIDTILAYSKNKFRMAARIVAWFYGGSSETWRKFLARRKVSKPIPKEVEKLLREITSK